jgi:uncharacterized membrane protein (UPF0127 family)
MTDRQGGIGRRAALAGVAGLVGFAGCAGLGDGGASTTTATATATDTDTAAGETTATATVGETTTTAATATDTPTSRSVFPGYETTAVVVRSATGETLGAVVAAVADTGDLRYTGLSDTAAMPEGYGMLFVYGDTARRTFVMRRMEFPLDMVFADGDGVITTIHEAPAPAPGEDGNDIRRSGRARYVLELNRGWSAARGVETGDRLAFDLP